MRILVTGAAGFAGSAAREKLAEDGHTVRGAVREKRQAGPGDAVVGDIGPETDWAGALDGVEAVLHLAGRAHVMRETGGDPLALFMRVNAEGSARLAGQAARAGVKRFVFVSTVKVNGEATGQRPFTEEDAPDPRDPYAVSKLEAEKRLKEIASHGGMELAIVRPPLVYGPGVKGNFLRLLRLVDRGIPLPLGRACNARSLVGLGNLLDFLAALLVKKEAAGETFLVSDGQDLSTAELIRRMAAALGRPCRMFKAPLWALRAAAAMTGRGAEASRLLDSLRVSTVKAGEKLGWTAPFTVDQELERTARWYKKTKFAENGGDGDEFSGG